MNAGYERDIVLNSSHRQIKWQVQRWAWYTPQNTTQSKSVDTWRSLKAKVPTQPHWLSWSFRANRIFRASELSICMISYIYKGVKFRSELQHTGTWSAAAWPLRRLCYRPAVFFRHFHLAALSFRQWKIRSDLENILFFFIFLIA
jgi:hypothetical protein